jgi:hypothetical protein
MKKLPEVKAYPEKYMVTPPSLKTLTEYALTNQKTVWQRIAVSAAVKVNHPARASIGWIGSDTGSTLCLNHAKYPGIWNVGYSGPQHGFLRTCQSHIADTRTPSASGMPRCPSHSASPTFCLVSESWPVNLSDRAAPANETPKMGSDPVGVLESRWLSQPLTLVQLLRTKIRHSAMFGSVRLTLGFRTLAARPFYPAGRLP